MAVTYYAGVSGIAAWSFVPRRSTYKLLMRSKPACGHIIAVDGHPIDVKMMAEDFAACFGFPKISPFYERCDANKTIGYEVGELLLKGELEEQHRLRAQSFDFYVQTLSAGMGLIGFHAAMEDLQAWTSGGLRPPRMAAIEIDEFAPVHDAWARGLEVVGDEVATPKFPGHALFEPTLWTTNIAKYYPHLRRMLRRSSGLLHAISAADVLQVMRAYDFAEELIDVGGPFAHTERAWTIGFAGLAQLVHAGTIPRGANVIVLVTGKGWHPEYTLQEPDAIVNPMDHKPIDIIRMVP
jgi:threonine synthase